MSTAEEANQRGNQLFQSGDVKGSVEAYSQAIGIAPKVAKYYGNRSNAHLTLGKYPKAAHDADKAIELDPTVPKYHYRAATAYVATKQWNLAQQRVASLLAMDPSNADAVELKKTVDEGLLQVLDPMTPSAAKILGEQLLAELDNDSNVYKLPSGLRFRLLARPVSATALSPTYSDECNVHYHGTLPNGTVFDSSYLRKEPTSFAPGQVIAGWTEALQYMAEGEKWEVYLPHELAYGARGSGRDLPGYSTLTFTIELQTVIGGAKQKTAKMGHTMLEAKLGLAYDELTVSAPRVAHP